MQAENEWEYDCPSRVTRAVDALEPRGDSLSIQLHMRWQVNALMDVVKMVHLNIGELVTLVAILAPARCHPVISEWDYDVRHRVSDAAKMPRDNSLAGVMRLRSELRDLMETVKITDLSVNELAAVLAVIAPANGRRLVTDTLDKVLRPILTLVDDLPDTGDAPLQLVELLTDADDEIGDAALVTS